MPLARYQPGSLPAPASSSSSRSTPSRTSSSKRKSGSQIDGNDTTSAQGASIDVEEFGPPEWRPVLNSKADLGYPDFYPSRPGFHQLEDVLTEENVKLGFQPKASIAVSSEGFSMHGMIHGQLTGDALGKLDALARELLAKRDESMQILGPRTYRLPPRVTYNDTKRLAFIADLANPEVPLYKLARQSVPHGYKGVDLLETMWSPAPPPPTNQTTASSSSTPPATPPGPVQVDRAAWFIRVLGANEVVALRNRPTNANALASSWTGKPLTPSQQYTNEFTSIFTAFLRKQLMELVLPQTAARASTSNQGNNTSASSVAVGKQSMGSGRNAGVLGDAAARNRWVAKWDYSLSLLRTFHTRYLISSRTLATWLADFAATCNLAQVGFVAQLINEYLEDVAKHASIARSALRALLDKLAEIRNCPAPETLKNVTASMKAIVQAMFSVNPDIMLSPTTWLRHSVTLQDIILSEVATLSPMTNGMPLAKSALDQESPASSSTIAISGILNEKGAASSSRRGRRLLAQFSDIRRRNERLLSRSTAASPNSMSPRRQAMADIQKLDSLSATTQVHEFMLQYFDGTASPTSGSLDQARLEEKIHILLVWSLNVFTLGDHRPYAVCTLLKKWQDTYVSHRPPDSDMDVDLFKSLYNWLESSEAAHKPENIAAIALTFGELTREGMFSYGQYLQLLIAKGYTARAAAQGSPRSHHLAILEALPIFVQDKGMLLQRRIVLYGLGSPLDKSRSAMEANNQARLRDEIARHVPELYGGPPSADGDTDWDPAEITRTCTRYEMVQARFWVFPLSVAFIDRLAPSSFVRMLNFFEVCRGYATVLDFILRALKAPVHNSVLNITLDTVRRGAEVWTAMDRQGELANALLSKFTRLQAEGHFNYSLWKQLKQFTQQGYLAPAAVPGRRMSLQYAAHNSTTKPVQSKGVPSMGLVAKMTSAAEIAATAASVLASDSGKLTSRQWTEILHVFSKSESEVNPKAICSFIAQLESTSGAEATVVIQEWLETQTPQSRRQIFAQQPANPTLRLLVQLVAVGCLQTTTLLGTLLFPLWTALAEDNSLLAVPSSIDLDQVVASTIAVATQLLLIPRHNRGLSPTFDIMEVKTLETSRADAFRDPDVIRLVKHLPLLVVLENEAELSDDTREAVAALRTGLSMVASFRTAAFRHLEMLKDVFLAPIWARHRIAALDARMIDALKAIMTDGGPSKPRSDQTLPPWSRNTARYSAWRWTRTVLELRLSFKQLAVRIVQGEDVDASRKALRELAQSMFSDDVNNDETDLICEAFRGVETVAVEQVVNAGIDHLSSLLECLNTAEAGEGDQAPTLLRSIENVVRMLQSIIEAHAQGVDLPIDTTGSASRDQLTLVLAALLRNIASSLKNQSDSTETDDPKPKPVIDYKPIRPILLRLKAVVAVIKFYLAVPHVGGSLAPSQKARQGLAEASANTLDVVWHLPSYGPETGVMAELLADVYCYLVDELPREARPALQAALSKLQAVNSSPQKAPTAVYLAQLLPYSSPPRRAMTLVDTDAGDNTWLFEDRPWEASEQLEPLERPIKYQDSFLDSAPLKNNSSIPLSAFDAKLCRDKVPLTEESMPWLSYASERNLGNGLAGEPSRTSLQATTIYNGDFQAPQPALCASEGPWCATSPSVASTYTREQPDQHAPTRSSGVNLSAPGSTNDPIEIDDDEDDEIELVPPPAKKMKASNPKPTTGSKTVGRKTASKTVKTVPVSTRGKGRRRSQAD